MHFADDKTNKNDNQDDSNKSASLQPQDNPYARKEVSYVCETGDELCMVVGGIFRRVREARELGESHGKSADLRIGELESSVVYHMLYILYILRCVILF